MKNLIAAVAGLAVALFASHSIAGDYYGDYGDYDSDCCCAPPVHYHSVVRYHAVSVLAGYQTVRKVYTVPVVSYRTVVGYSHVPVYTNHIYRTIHQYATYGCCD
jgi:hypothetical protein